MANMRIRTTRSLLYTQPPYGLPGGVMIDPGTKFTLPEEVARPMIEAKEAEEIDENDQPIASASKPHEPEPVKTEETHKGGDGQGGQPATETKPSPESKPNPETKPQPSGQGSGGKK